MFSENTIKNTLTPMLCQEFIPAIKQEINKYIKIVNNSNFGAEYNEKLNKLSYLLIKTMFSRINKPWNDKTKQDVKQAILDYSYIQDGITEALGKNIFSLNESFFDDIEDDITDNVITYNNDILCKELSKIMDEYCKFFQDGNIVYLTITHPHFRFVVDIDKLNKAFNLLSLYGVKKLIINTDRSLKPNIEFPITNNKVGRSIDDIIDFKNIPCIFEGCTVVFYNITPKNLIIENCNNITFRQCSLPNIGKIWANQIKIAQCYNIDDFSFIKRVETFTFAASCQSYMSKTHNFIGLPKNITEISLVFAQEIDKAAPTFTNEDKNTLYGIPDDVESLCIKYVNTSKGKKGSDILNTYLKAIQLAGLSKNILLNPNTRILIHNIKNNLILHTSDKSFNIETSGLYFRVDSQIIENMIKNNDYTLQIE